MNAFLTKELLLWIQAKYRVHKEAKHTTSCRFQSWWPSSFLYSTSKSIYFGNVLSMSGSVHWKKDGYENQIPWIENQISSIDSNATQPQFYLAAGELENKPLLTANRRLYKALKKEKEYQITCEEFQGGHDGVWWREKLFDGLKALKRTKKHATIKYKEERFYESRRN